jgi:hypothetical protein
MEIDEQIWPRPVLIILGILGLCSNLQSFAPVAAGGKVQPRPNSAVTPDIREKEKGKGLSWADKLQR